MKRLLLGLLVAEVVVELLRHLVGRGRKGSGVLEVEGVVQGRQREGGRRGAELGVGRKRGVKL